MRSAGLSRELERSQDRLARLRRQADREGADPALAEAAEELGQTLDLVGSGNLTLCAFSTLLPGRKLFAELGQFRLALLSELPFLLHSHL